MLLMDQHVRGEHKEKKKLWTTLDYSEDGPDYANVDEVELPTQQLPSFKPKDLQYMTQREALDAISNAVASVAEVS